MINPPPLVPGSPAARAAFEVLSGEPSVLVEEQPGADPLRAACHTIVTLLTHRPQLEVVLLADGGGRASNLYPGQPSR